jgi:hypothetical protein
LYFSHAPLYALSVIGMATILASFAILILSLAFVHHHVWLALIVCGFIFLSGLQFLLLGVVGLYIAKIFDEVRARPVYIVSEISGRMLDLDKEKKSPEEVRTNSPVVTAREEHVFEADPLFSDFRNLPHIISGQSADPIL